ncbi:MAG: hypothetical protein DWQ02_05010 [Bacteroidetes bacterium]|nr:MAG: hypothetical protein DWQ02_05010 [Bacteroidota bacterium]
MLRTILLTAAIFMAFSTFSFSKTIDIREAIKSGMIKVEPVGNGGYKERCLKLKVQNLQKKKLEVYVPAGLLFHSLDSVVQDLIIIQDRMLALDKLEGRSFSVYAMCTQASNRSPQKDTRFETGDEAEGALLKVVKFIDEKNIRTSPGQYAIWAVTDDHRIENIRHEELAIFTAELLGKPIPKYFIQHENYDRPGQPAFQPRPAVIDGVFEYTTGKDRRVSFGLYNADGELLHEGFKDQLQKKGSHKFKFRFEVRHIESGKYYARLMSDGEVLKELSVEF